MYKQAIAYRELGWSIFPVKTDKTPAVYSWKEYQERYPTDIELNQWWGKGSLNGIALVTGKLSGIVVVDDDRPKHNIKGGIGFPLTVTSKTGGGGLHHFFRHPGVPVPNSSGEIEKYIDVRGDGGYVLLPPSKNKSGEYEWFPFLSPQDLGFAELPKTILEKKNENQKRVTNWGEFIKEPVLEGERNMTATKYAGKLLHDLSPELWETAGWSSLKDWNRNNCTTPLSAEELRSVFESIKKRHLKNKNISSKHQERGHKAKITCYKNIQSEEISWLWKGRIALGKLTLISGDPGLGKSLITATLASYVSKGTEWPIGEGTAPKGDVVLLSAEDDPADTTRPRLDAAGADIDRIHALEAVYTTDDAGKEVKRMFSLKKDVEVLSQLLPDIPNCRLLVIDPISAYLDGTDSHNNSDVRGLLAPLGDLAAKHKIAILLVSHLNKNSGGNAQYRTMGSLAFTAAVRAAYIVTKDKDNPDRRLVMPLKNNLAKDNTGLAYSVSSAQNGAPVLIWENEPVTISLEDALSSKIDEDKIDREWTIEFLEEALKNGPLPFKELLAQAKEAGVTEKQLRRAEKELNIRPRKSSFSGPWVWEMANQGAQDISEKEGNLGDLGT